MTATNALADVLMSCPCVVCARHGEVHPQVARTILGRTVHVDAALVDLLDALAAAGVVTIASCVNLAEAVWQLAPASLAGMIAQADAPGVHYGRVVRDRLAFVRVIPTPSAAAFLDPGAVPGTYLNAEPLTAQLAFPISVLPALMRRAQGTP